MLLKKFLGIKKKSYNSKIKHYIFGIPIWKEKYQQDRIKHYFLGIPVWRIKFSGENIKIYFLGIQIIKLKNKVIVVEHAQNNLSMIKAFELFETRKNCNYERKQQ